MVILLKSICVYNGQMHKRRVRYFCSDSPQNLVSSEHRSTWEEFIHPNQLITETILSLKQCTYVNALERLSLTITGVLATKSWKAHPLGVYKIN
jgi:hypothetical protein